MPSSKPPLTLQAERVLLGRTVAYLRSKKGQTQSDFVGELLCTPSTYSRIERGSSSPSLTGLRQISAGLGITLDVLFQYVDQARDATQAIHGDSCEKAIEAVGLTGFAGLVDYVLHVADSRRS